MSKSDSQFKLSVSEIVSGLSAAVKKADTRPVVESQGRITVLGDGVATVEGLPGARLGELVDLPGKIRGLVLNLRREETSIVIFGDYGNLREGDPVKPTGEVMQVPAGYGSLGRVVNALFSPLDGKGALKASKEDKLMPVENIAPGVIRRQDVRTPLQTGVRVIDALLPIGRGQRELIIGDRGTGKTALAIDAIINQSRLNKKLLKGEKRVISIYVAIGQKQSKVAQVVAKLESEGAMTDTVIVSASASDSASLQYLAPFSATALAEYYMDKGEDVLIIYDDLTKHAWAYRQLSLLLRRPSGREAYPGDIFFLHSRLLERSARMHDRLGGGSITALPIIETQAGDISAYIPTNVISITDGQIFLEPDIFYAGIRPAVSVGLSVSRVGGDAQIKAMKQVAGKLKLDLAQYRELAAFAQFGSELDEATQKRLDRGKILTELLKQPQYKPQPVEVQVAGIWLAMQGYLDNLEQEKITPAADEFVSRLEKHKSNPLADIRSEKVISPATEKILNAVAQAWKGEQ